MTELLLDLPFPPSLNTYYRNVHGRTLLSAKGREYKQDVLAHVLTACKGKPETMTGRLSVHIYLHNAAAECRLSSYGRLRGWRDKPGFSLSIEDDLVGRGAGLDGFGVLTADLGRVGPTGTLRR